MSLFNLFRKQKSAPVARERLQLLLAHERASGDSDLVSVLREEILAVIARHVDIGSDRVHIRMEREEDMSILEVEVEIPFDSTAKAA